MVVKVKKDKLIGVEYVPKGAEYPVIEDSPNSPIHESIERHPAYAMIGASRVSSTGEFLYGSDFKHQHYIEITIRGSELCRGLSNDYYAARDELISLKVSEAQWASFVSTLNQGMGTPCTLEHVGGHKKPDIAGIIPRKEQFKKEMEKLGEEGNAALAELDRELDALNISEKKRKELKWKVTMARRATGNSAEFVAEQFGEHIEKTTEHAKIEIEAFVNNAVRQVGLDTLKGRGPFTIPESKTKKLK